MIKAVVKFFGATQDPFGMPIPYHSYLVVSSPWQASNSGIASVVALSASAPLSKPHVLVLQGGERAAFDAALQALASEPANVGLTQHSHEG
jgi:hypothetical protein